MGKFSLMDYMNEESKKMQNAADTTDFVSVYDIEPNEQNFYGMRKIQLLKESILLMDGVQENLILVKQPDGSRYKYKALAGHRRRQACLELTEEGFKQYELVPATIKENITAKEERAILLLTNSTQRGELTDYEKVMEHIETKEMLIEYKKDNKLEGKIREMEAEYLGVSSGQISIYNKIANNLISGLMAVFEKGAINISVAAESAGQDKEVQEKILRFIQDNGTATIDDVKRISGSSCIKGQVTTDDLPELHVVKQKQIDTEECEEEKEDVLNLTTENLKEDSCLVDTENNESDYEPHIEKVTDSVTYDLTYVQDYMEMYKRELKNCIDNNMQKSAKRNKMILDALALLEEKMK